MTPKIVVSLAVAAFVSLAAAAYAYYGNQQWNPSLSAGEPLLPRLADRANDVAEVVIDGRGRALRLARRDGDWVLADRSGYPALGGPVRALVLSLANATRIEAKTANPDRFAALGLDDPQAPEAKSVAVTLLDAAGEEIASAILGRTRYGAAGPGRPGTYVRLTGDDQTWLVAGELSASPAVDRWVEPKILDFDVDKVARTVIRHPDGTVMELERSGEDDDGRPTFEIVGMADGSTPKSPSALRQAATDFVSLRLEDVRERQGRGQEVPATAVDLTTTDGLALRLTLRKESDGNWLAVDVIEPGTADKEADDIAARLDGWEFALSASQAAPFDKQLADLVDPPEPPLPGEAEEGAEPQAE